MKDHYTKHDQPKPNYSDILLDVKKKRENNTYNRIQLPFISRNIERVNFQNLVSNSEAEYQKERDYTTKDYSSINPQEILEILEICQDTLNSCNEENGIKNEKKTNKAAKSSKSKKGSTLKHILKPRKKEDPEPVNYDFVKEFKEKAEQSISNYIKTNSDMIDKIKVDNAKEFKKQFPEYFDD